MNDDDDDDDDDDDNDVTTIDITDTNDIYIT